MFAKQEVYKGVESIILQINERTHYRIFSPGKDQSELLHWHKSFLLCCVGNKYDSFYTTLDLLGKGSFASVYRVKKNDV